MSLVYVDVWTLQNMQGNCMTRSGPKSNFLTNILIWGAGKSAVVFRGGYFLLVTIGLGIIVIHFTMSGLWSCEGCAFHGLVMDVDSLKVKY